MVKSGQNPHERKGAGAMAHSLWEQFPKNTTVMRKNHFKLNTTVMSKKIKSSSQIGVTW